MGQGADTSWSTRSGSDRWVGLRNDRLRHDRWQFGTSYLPCLTLGPSRRFPQRAQNDHFPAIREPIAGSQRALIAIRISPQLARMHRERKSNATPTAPCSSTGRSAVRQQGRTCPPTGRLACPLAARPRCNLRVDRHSELRARVQTRRSHRSNGAPDAVTASPERVPSEPAPSLLGIEETRRESPVRVPHPGRAVWAGRPVGYRVRRSRRASRGCWGNRPAAPPAVVGWLPERRSRVRDPIEFVAVYFTHCRTPTTEVGRIHEDLSRPAALRWHGAQVPPPKRFS